MSPPCPKFTPNPTSPHLHSHHPRLSPHGLLAGPLWWPLSQPPARVCLVAPPACRVRRKASSRWRGQTDSHTYYSRHSGWMDPHESQTGGPTGLNYRSQGKSLSAGFLICKTYVFATRTIQTKNRHHDGFDSTAPGVGSPRSPTYWLHDPGNLHYYSVPQ